MGKKKERVLILTDLQRDFMPGGSLGVSGANFTISTINQLIDCFEHVISVSDWHPTGHVSFASTHGKRVGEVIQIDNMEQILWPDHCIQESRGAGFTDELKVDKIEAKFRKGVDLSVDSYSAFFDAKNNQATELAAYLKERQLKELYFVGVATDYSILYSVLDALKLGFQVAVILDVCRSINRRLGDEQRAIEAMKAAGAKIITSEELLKSFSK